MNITIPKDVKFIIDSFYKNGYEAFMVGGCIRDALLNKIPSDYDIATSAPPEITESIFTKTIPTGIKHGTVTVIINNINYEVTTYRTDGNYINNRKPEKVMFISNIKDDLSRRDFTINSLAYNHQKGLVDYFSGNKDLKNKIIRCVGTANTRFNEDALRMLRAIRFSSQLNFTVEELTYLAIKSNAHLIENISKERIRVEFSKILLSSNTLKGLISLSDTAIMKYIIPFDIFICSNINILPKNLACRLSSLFINLDINLISNLLKTLTFDNLTIKNTLLLIKNYRKIINCTSKPKCKRIINSVGIDNIINLIKLYECCEEKDLSPITSLVNEILTENTVLSIKDLSINGTTLKNELGLSSGKLIGEILNHLLDLVIDEKVNNTNESLIEQAKNYITIHSKI